MRKCKPHTVYIYDVLSKNGDIAMNLAEKLIYLRKKQGLTQLELAEKLDVSRQAVSRWEGGYAVPGTDNLKTLSELFEIPVDYLLNDKTDIDETEYEEEKKEEKNNCLKEKSEREEKSRTFILVLLLFVTFVLAGIAFLKPKTKDHIIPMDDMTITSEEEYTTYKFSIE